MAAEPTTFLFDIAVVLAAAAVVTLVFHLLRLPTVLGYLAAGILIGPHTTTFALVRDLPTIQALAELGIVFLMFSVGMEFNIRKLVRVGPLVLVAAALEILFMMWLGYAVGGLLGWEFADRVFLGAILSISSTTILTKVLIEMDMLDAEHAPVVFGLLIIEDVVAVLILTGLSSLGLSGGIEAAVVWRTFLQVGLFLLAALAIGLYVVPRVVRVVARLEHDEILVLAVLGLLLGVSLVAQLLGFSVALGAFLVGALVSEAKESPKVEHRIVGLRDMFTAVFFVSVGMLADPRVLLEHWPALVVISLAAILGKLVMVTTGAFVAGNRPAVALRAGISMAVIGEFSFIIADLGARLGVTSGFLFPLVVGVSLVTALASPVLLRENERIIGGLRRVTPGPLKTYARLYQRWAERLRAGPPGRLAAARRQLGRAALQLAGLVGILAAAKWSSGLFADRLAVVGVWVAAGLLALPFAVGFGRRAGAFARELTTSAVPFEGAGAPAGRVVLNTVRFLATLALGAFALVVAAPFLPPGPVVVVVLAAVAASLWFLGESVLRLNREFEDAIDRAVQGEPEEERGEVRRLIESQYPWAADAQRVTVPTGSAAAGRSLRDLQIRNRTGATAAVVLRGTEHVLNPTPDFVLEPGDRLTFVGEPAQVEAAVGLVRTPREEVAAAEAALREVALPPESPHIGRTLADTRLRERTGATVIGLARGGRRLPHPPPDQVLEAGDVLLLVGTADQVARAAVHLRAPSD